MGGSKNLRTSTVNTPPLSFVSPNCIQDVYDLPDVCLG